MKLRGYTIVELIIVITIMGILLSLGTVSMLNSQASGRDSERKADIDAIALHLENLYLSGNADKSFNSGRYPSTAELGTNPASYLRDIDPKSLDAPPASGVSDLIYASDTNIPTTSATSIDKYMYQPLYLNGSTWQICTAAIQECRKFVLYAKLENGTPYQIESKNQ